MPYKPDLSAFFFEPSFKVLVGPALHAKMDVVRKQGNNAVHSARPDPRIQQPNKPQPRPAHKRPTHQLCVTGPDVLFISAQVDELFRVLQQV